MRRSSRNTILLQSAKEEVLNALHELDVEKEHNLALQESIHKRDTHVLHLDEQVVLLRSSLDSTNAEIDEVLQQLRASEFARELLQAKVEEQAEELKACRRELEEMRRIDEDADEVEGRNSKKFSVQPVALADDCVPHRTVRRDQVFPPQGRISIAGSTARSSTLSANPIFDDLELSMQQCEKLQTTVEWMSTECTLLRCLAEWRLVVSEHRKENRAANSDAELQKLSGAAKALMEEVKRLGEHIAAVAPGPPKERVVPKISEATGRSLVLRCQLATLTQECRDWRAALLLAIPLEAKPTQEEKELALFRGRLSNGSFVDELGDCMEEPEPEGLKSDSKGPSIPAGFQDLLQLFCRFVRDSDQKVSLLEAKIADMEALRKLQYGLG